MIKRRNRNEILRVAAAMADELTERAHLATDQAEAVTYLRSAQHFRELLSIARGTKSSAYWDHQHQQRIHQLQRPRLPQPLSEELAHVA